MKKAFILMALAIVFFTCSSKKRGTKDNIEKPLTNEEVASGLKEALNIAANNSTENVSRTNRNKTDSALLIPFPPQAEKMKQKLIQAGLGNKIMEFETAQNNAAIKAAAQAAPIFNEAIKDMDIQEAFKILNESDTAATHYLRVKTYPVLVEKLKPGVKASIAELKVTSYWDPLMNAYNKIPFVEKQNPDLEDYITQMMVQGLFKLISKEEIKIRKNPAARGSVALIRVFGQKTAQ